MIRCCAKNCSSVTPRCGQFLRYLQCCNTLQVFESDSKTCNSIARIRSKLVSVTCCRQFLSQRWPEFSARIKEGIWGEVGPSHIFPCFEFRRRGRFPVWSYFVSWCVSLWPTWLRDILQEWLQGLFCFLLDLHVSNNLLSTSWWTELYYSNGSITTFVGRLPRLFLEIHLKTFAIQLHCAVCNTSCAGEIKLLVVDRNSFAWNLGSPPLCDSCYRFTLSINKKSMVLDTTTYVFQWL